jgi:hypothetical protein
VPDSINLLIHLALLAIPLAFLISWLWRRNLSRKATEWPDTEGEIQSGCLETVAHNRYGELQLPVFTFTYQVGGQYYGGRFALRPYITDPGISVIERLRGQKLQVRFNPMSPEEWFIPNEYIEGCRVEQSLSPDLVNFKPLN